MADSLEIIEALSLGTKNAGNLYSKGLEYLDSTTKYFTKTTDRKSNEHFATLDDWKFAVGEKIAEEFGYDSAIVSEVSFSAGHNPLVPKTILPGSAGKIVNLISAKSAGLPLEVKTLKIKVVDATSTDIIEASFPAGASTGLDANRVDQSLSDQLADVRIATNVNPYEQFDEPGDFLDDFDLFDRDEETLALTGEKQLCFGPDTLVQLPGGASRRIADVKLGDKVLAFSSATGALEPAKVTQTHVTPDQKVIDHLGTIVTPGHVYMCPDEAYRQVGAVLNANGFLVNAAGEIIRARTGEVISRETFVMYQAMFGPSGVPAFEVGFGVAAEDEQPAMPVPQIGAVAGATGLAKAA